MHDRGIARAGFDGVDPEVLGELRIDEENLIVVLPLRLDREFLVGDVNDLVGLADAPAGCEFERRGKIGGIAEPAEVDAPERDQGRALVEIHAVPLNPIDTALSAGKHYLGPPKTPYVPGSEGVGVVVEAESLEPGTRVYVSDDGLGGRGRDGTLAERATVREEEALVLPDEDTWRRLGSLPEMTELPADYAPLRGDAAAQEAETVLAAAFATAPAADWVRRLRGLDLLAELVETMDRDRFRQGILDDPVNRQLGRVAAYETADWGWFEQIGPLLRWGPSMSGGPPLIPAGNAVGQPALSVPNGLGAHGLPTGLQFTGRAWSEARLLALAQAYQKATDWHRRRPPLKS